MLAKNDSKANLSPSDLADTTPSKRIKVSLINSKGVKCIDINITLDAKEVNACSFKLMQSKIISKVKTRYKTLLTDKDIPTLKYHLNGNSKITGIEITSTEQKIPVQDFIDGLTLTTVSIRDDNKIKSISEINPSLFKDINSVLAKNIVSASSKTKIIVIIEIMFELDKLFCDSFDKNCKYFHPWLINGAGRCFESMLTHLTSEFVALCKKYNAEEDYKEAIIGEDPNKTEVYNWNVIRGLQSGKVVLLTKFLIKHPPILEFLDKKLHELLPLLEKANTAYLKSLEEIDNISSEFVKNSPKDTAIALIHRSKLEKLKNSWVKETHAIEDNKLQTSTRTITVQLMHKDKPPTVISHEIYQKAYQHAAKLSKNKESSNVSTSIAQLEKSIMAQSTTSLPEESVNAPSPHTPSIGAKLNVSS